MCSTIKMAGNVFYWRDKMESYYSVMLGLAAEDLTDDNMMDLEVYVPEINPFFEGELDPNKEPLEQSIIDHNVGRPEKVKIDTSDSIT